MLLFQYFRIIMYTHNDIFHNILHVCFVILLAVNSIEKIKKKPF